MDRQMGSTFILLLFGYTLSSCSRSEALVLVRSNLRGSSIG